MTKLSELKAQVEALQVQIEQLEKSKRFKPERGEKYYAPQNNRTIGPYEWENDVIDNYLYDRGLVFRTEEEAKAWDADCVEYYAVLRELQDIAEGFEPDWEDKSHGKYVLYSDVNNNRWNHVCYYNSQFSGLPVFATPEQANAALALGDRLDVLLRWPR